MYRFMIEEVLYSYSTAIRPYIYIFGSFPDHAVNLAACITAAQKRVAFSP